MTQPDQQKPGPYQSPTYGQPYPQNPPSYPELKPLPPNWQQPIQPQWNPNGVYSGAPEPKKEGIPWWGTAIILVLALAVVASIGFTLSISNSSKTPNPTSNNQALVVEPTNTVFSRPATQAPKPTATERPTPTEKPAPTERPTITPRPTETPFPPTITPDIPGTRAAVANITELARQRNQRAQATIDALNQSLKDTFSKPKEIGTKIDGPGQELVGQVVNDDGLNVIISKVERFSQINNYDKSFIQTTGAFLVVNYDMFNGSHEPKSLIFIKLADAQGRAYTPTSNLDATFAVAFISNYQDDFTVQPTLWGKGYSVFEIPKDATNLKLKIGF